MRKLFLLLSLLSLIGLGCQKNSGNITTDKIQQALAQTANDLGWSEDVISKEPSEENFYGNSYLLYGPAKESGLDNLVDNIEVIKFFSSAKAQDVYKADNCLKGSGKPITIFGTNGCCLNDVEKETSIAIMSKDEFVFKSATYFSANCGAAEYLKSLWKNL